MSWKKRKQQGGANEANAGQVWREKSSWNTGELEEGRENKQRQEAGINLLYKTGKTQLLTEMSLSDLFFEDLTAQNLLILILRCFYMPLMLYAIISTCTMPTFTCNWVFFPL